MEKKDLARRHLRRVLVLKYLMSLVFCNRKMFANLCSNDVFNLYLSRSAVLYGKTEPVTALRAVVMSWSAGSGNFISFL
jgi:hypothetical protein